MCLTDDERAALAAQLKDAEAAYHRLMTGTSARVVVDQNGERVEFTATNRQQLYAYIQGLKSKLGLLTPGCGAPLGPASFTF